MDTPPLFSSLTFLRCRAWNPAPPTGGQRSPAQPDCTQRACPDTTDLCDQDAPPRGRCWFPRASVTKPQTPGSFKRLGFYPQAWRLQSRSSCGRATLPALAPEGTPCPLACGHAAHSVPSPHSSLPCPNLPPHRDPGHWSRARLHQCGLTPAVTRTALLPNGPHHSPRARTRQALSGCHSAHGMWSRARASSQVTCCRKQR